MIKKFENYLIELKLSENTYKSYISDLRQYMKYYEESYGEKLIKLNSADIQTYISYIKNRLNRKPSTINRILTSLKTFNDFLVEQGIQKNTVISKRDYIKIQNSFVKEDVPDEKQINKLKHAAINNKRDYCVVCLASYGRF